MKIRAIEDGDVEDVVALWDACGLTRQWNAHHDDIALIRATTQS